MPAVRVVKSVAGYIDGAIHDSADFGDQLERLLRKGCLEPLEHIALPGKPPSLADFHAEVELLTEKIGTIEKDRDDWKAKALAAATSLEAAEKDRDDWKAKANAAAKIDPAPTVSPRIEDAFDVDPPKPTATTASKQSGKK